MTPISDMKLEKPSLVSSWYLPSMLAGSCSAEVREETRISGSKRSIVGV